MAHVTPTMGSAPVTMASRGLVVTWSSAQMDVQVRVSVTAIVVCVHAMTDEMDETVLRYNALQTATVQASATILWEDATALLVGTVQIAPSGLQYWTASFHRLVQHRAQRGLPFQGSTSIWIPLFSANFFKMTFRQPCL